MNLSLPITIKSDWPEEVKALLHPINELIESQGKQIKRLQVENEKLQERLNLNSKNSSKPPSTDQNPKKKKKSKKRSTGRSKGGQKGHKGSQRELVTSDEVYEQIISLSPCEER